MLTTADSESTKLLAGYYLESRRARERLGPIKRLADFHWSELPSAMPIQIVFYKYMLDEFSSGISNSINDLGRYTLWLRAWHEVIDGLDDETKIRLVMEFIDPVATTVINLPHVIKGRFIYATAHLSHQANRAKDPANWADDFPLDGDVVFGTADLHASKWRRYKRLKRRIERIAASDYKSGTSDFRNKYNHRFSPRVAVGMSDFVVRKVSPVGKVTYTVGGSDALALDQIATLLDTQRDLCFGALDAFKELVREQSSVLLKAFGDE